MVTTNLQGASTVWAEVPGTNITNVDGTKTATFSTNDGTNKFFQLIDTTNFTGTN